MGTKPIFAFLRLYVYNMTTWIRARVAITLCIHEWGDLGNDRRLFVSCDVTTAEVQSRKLKLMDSKSQGNLNPDNGCQFVS